jgi:2'-deoxynucleoside 5'-phosphate N-hydrolase
MTKKINKIYIAGALTHAGEKQKKIYEKIAEICESVCDDVYVPHLGGTDPVKHPDVTPQDVWKKNHYIVSSSDLIVAYVGEPSLGVGAELEIAHHTGSDIILWWFKGEKVSRMSRGNPSAKVQIEAEGEEDLYKKIKLVLDSINK